MKSMMKIVIGLAIGAAMTGAAQAQAVDAEPTYASCMAEKADVTSIKFSDGPMPIGSCDSNTGRVGLVFPLWKEQMPEVLARFRAELLGGYAQATLANAHMAPACSANAKEARALLSRAAASYFFASEFTNSYPRSVIARRINGALDEIYQANAISQICKRSDPHSENPVAKYGEEKRIRALWFRRPVAAGL